MKKVVVTYTRTFDLSEALETYESDMDEKVEDIQEWAKWYLEDFNFNELAYDYLVVETEPKPKFTTYNSEKDGVLVIHIDTDDEGFPHTLNGAGEPIMRVYVNDDTDNPIYEKASDIASMETSMNKLGERNYLLISRGVKTFGSYDPDEIFPIFEEELYMSESTEIWNFLAWCHNEDKRFGHGNYEERFAEYKSVEEDYWNKVKENGYD